MLSVHQSCVSLSAQTPEAKIILNNDIIDSRNTMVCVHESDSFQLERIELYSYTDCYF